MRHKKQVALMRSRGTTSLSSAGAGPAASAEMGGAATGETPVLLCISTSFPLIDTAAALALAGFSDCSSVAVIGLNAFFFLHIFSKSAPRLEMFSS